MTSPRMMSLPAVSLLAVSLSNPSNLSNHDLLRNDARKNF
ncbi:hypothetical protein D3OALGA1CA_5102 [Olavius algarvensis associated proteobacterium Delta 3]|nr:hypothetical protein D3OALGA1CA_5102 [Olavius algarvensis associated proteobacterium Delta 3]